MLETLPTRLSCGRGAAIPRMILRRSAAGIVLYAYGAAAECAGCTKKLFEPTCDGFSKKTDRWGNWYERHVPVPQSTLAPTTSPAPTASRAPTTPRGADTPAPTVEPTPEPTPQPSTGAPTTPTAAPTLISLRTGGTCPKKMCCAEQEEDCCLVDPPRVLGMCLAILAFFFLAVVVARPRWAMPKGLFGGKREQYCENHDVHVRAAEKGV